MAFFFFQYEKVPKHGKLDGEIFANKGVPFSKIPREPALTLTFDQL